MGRHVGVSHSTVQRIWSKNEFRRTSSRRSLSNDPFRGEVLGRDRTLSRSPTNALVLCCDEKSQCQALERTQPGLPLKAKRPPTMTHDYTRHGVVTLFAALIAVSGKFITRAEARHTHVEWLRFLKADRPPDGQTPRCI